MFCFGEKLPKHNLHPTYNEFINGFIHEFPLQIMLYMYIHAETSEQSARLEIYKIIHMYILHFAIQKLLTAKAMNLSIRKKHLYRTFVRFLQKQLTHFLI